jgi:hypothetical protein
MFTPARVSATPEGAERSITTIAKKWVLTGEKFLEKAFRH